MLCLCSHASELAIRAAMHLAAQPPGKLTPVHEIAEGTGLPAAYLAKIMRYLIREGLVRAFRGPGGGVELGRPPDSISLAALMRAVDGDANVDRCILGIGGCSSLTPCPLHSRWAPLRAEFQRLMEQTSIAALAAASHENPAYIEKALSYSGNSESRARR